MRDEWPSAEEWDSLEWLHVYGQHSYHADATIKATRAGLVELRNAVDKALSDGSGQARVMASDGEGYRLEVVLVSTHAQMGEPEYLFEEHGRLMAEEAERAKRFGLRDPFGKYIRLDDPRAAERIKSAQEMSEFPVANATQQG